MENKDKNKVLEVCYQIGQLSLQVDNLQEDADCQLCDELPSLGNDDIKKLYAEICDIIKQYKQLQDTILSMDLFKSISDKDLSDYWNKKHA